ncbi:4-(cytidine 5'-diphospho)-2-C-methyl-D-erythritol kinase [Vannielia litorea]|uniref:4-(cytidine 5'-diphospho)-2-C-methyl-D-erythritol kinase n=1 Tax=Vannielia litorea TaxID=1217970 RepID=UPI001C960D77|nr:4-(cytidine 5'-diphospho)-2-C-methyl-D-erythritol kinase [Vannielia litorea]MBY6154126.1 4-(cytidine 5'-diphospho)-2-C-methyl-D-erythritol kinase [Vannielia litorea]
MTKVEAFAPAKINLALHVTGRRSDGYHLLDSLVCFANVGDHLTLTDAPGMSLGASGPFGASVPPGPSNLVLRAAELMEAEAERLGVAVGGVSIQLEKHLPISSGLGGGSADAAAALRALSDLWGVAVPGVHRLAKELGADVPVCLDPGASWRMRGIGEELTRLERMPQLNLLLVNPRVPVSTAAVFGRMEQRDNAPMPEPPEAPSRRELVEWLAWQRNDLEAPACSLAPEIGEVLGELRAQEGAMLARMSGSGASCFAIFEDNEARDRAAGVLREDWPEWWVAEG